MFVEGGRFAHLRDACRKRTGYLRRVRGMPYRQVHKVFETKAHRLWALSETALKVPSKLLVACLYVAAVHSKKSLTRATMIRVAVYFVWFRRWLGPADQGPGTLQGLRDSGGHGEE